MKNRLTMLLTFLLGGLFGAFITKQHFEDLYKKDVAGIEAELNRLQGMVKPFDVNSVLELRKEAAVLANEIVEQKMTDPYKPNEADLKENEKQVKNYTKYAMKKDIAEVMKERGIAPFDDHPHDDEPVDQDEPEEEEEEEEEEVEDIDPATDDKSIHLITSDEFYNTNAGFEKHSLTYYEGDNCLADSMDSLVPYPDRIIGPNALNSFGKNHEDLNIVHVRNNATSCDFEISRSLMSYQEAVLGIKPEEKKVVKKTPVRIKEEVEKSKPTRTKKVAKDVQD